MKDRGAGLRAVRRTVSTAPVASTTSTKYDQPSGTSTPGSRTATGSCWRRSLGGTTSTSSAEKTGAPTSADTTAVVGEATGASTGVVATGSGGMARGAGGTSAKAGSPVDGAWPDGVPSDVPLGEGTDKGTFSKNATSTGVDAASTKVGGAAVMAGDRAAPRDSGGCGATGAANRGRAIARRGEALTGRASTIVGPAPRANHHATDTNATSASTAKGAVTLRNDVRVCLSRFTSRARAAGDAALRRRKLSSSSAVVSSRLSARGGGVVICARSSALGRGATTTG